MPKAFLTGANGFLGPHVSETLRSLGYEVFESTTLLNDVETLAKELSHGPWDVVFHMAGMSLPAECRAHPERAYEVNLLGTVDLAKLLSDADVRGPLVFFSTAYVYSSDLEGPISETSATMPIEVYGKTKLAAERALESAAPALKFPILVLRLFNHSHKSQASDFFLPKMYRTIFDSSAVVGSTVTVPMGDPKLKRDFNSIQEFRSTIEALVIAATRTHGFNVYNLCSGQPRELGCLVKTLARKSGLSAELKPLAERMRPGEPQSVFGDPAKLANFLKRPVPKFSDEEFIDQFLADIPATPKAEK